MGHPVLYYSVTHLLADLVWVINWVDLGLGCSTVLLGQHGSCSTAQRPVEHPKSKLTQPGPQGDGSHCMSYDHLSPEMLKNALLLPSPCNHWYFVPFSAQRGGRQGADAELGGGRRDPAEGHRRIHLHLLRHGHVLTHGGAFFALNYFRFVKLQ